jgi:drug/metabolite transporter (DMT)-like permease
MQAGSGQERLGAVLVFLSALFWSIGGTIDRFLDIADGWTVIFWRSFWAASFLITFMLLRDGGRGTVRLFASMGLPGLAVSLCFATASTAFVVALAYTTVANILLMQAGVPLIAALIGWVVFRERVGGLTRAANRAVKAGVVIMVSE